MQKLDVAILGATGAVGQRFIQLLENHPWFIACQFHPEFTSTPRDGHPLFTSYIQAALDKKRPVKRAATHLLIR